MQPYVPLIDIAPFQGSPAERSAVAASIDDAFRTCGFLTLTGHGVASATIDAAFEQAHAFFSLPEDIKRRSVPPALNVFRGYNGVASQRSGNKFKKSLPPDLRENYMMSRIDVSDPYFSRPEFGATYAPNIWPQEPAGYRVAWEQFYREMDDLANRLMRICAVALEIEENFFDSRNDRASSTCVANHYPAQATPPEPGQLRAGAHSDVGSVTLLLQERAHGGLQVLDKTDTWRDVVTEKHQIIVNVGDLLAQWTNDRWVSTKHRVVNPPREHATTDRMSLSYFQHPNYDAEVACIPTCVTPGNPEKYPPITAGEHMHRRMMQAREWKQVDAAE